MKKHIVSILIAALLVTTAGCRASEPAETTGNPGTTKPSSSTETTAPTTGTTEPGQTQAGAVGVLETIWNGFPEDSRFAVYGGMMEKPVDSAPGKLDLSNTEEILSQSLIPQERLGEVEEGASLVHLMNSNLFTAAAFRLKNDADAETFAKALRENIQKNQWICGQPDRLVVAAPAGDTVLMVFGSEEAMELFGDSFTRAFPDAKVYFDEAITA